MIKIILRSFITIFIHLKLNEKEAGVFFARRQVMRQTLVSLLLSFVTFCASSPARGYDLSSSYLTHPVVDNVIQSSVPVRVSERYQDVDGANHEESRKGTGVVLCDKETERRYILTAEHLFPTNRKLPFYIQVKDLGITDYKRSYNHDLALLETDNKTHPCFQGKVGSASHSGDSVFYVGFPGDATVPIFREGRLMKGPDDQHIYHEAHSYPGDSGGLVIALEFGTPRLVGISRAMRREFGEETPWAAAINGSRICDFLQGTAVHNDYCEAKK